MRVMSFKPNDPFMGKLDNLFIVTNEARITRAENSILRLSLPINRNSK